MHVSVYHLCICVYACICRTCFVVYFTCLCCVYKLLYTYVYYILMYIYCTLCIESLYKLQAIHEIYWVSNLISSTYLLSKNNQLFVCIYKFFLFIFKRILLRIQRGMYIRPGSTFQNPRFGKRIGGATRLCILMIAHVTILCWKYPWY